MTRELTSQEAFTWLTKITPGCRNADLEKIIATDRECSYHYAKDVLKGRFELGEPIIAQCAHHAYHYARNVLKGRFELGEPVIAKGAWSYHYALNVLDGRFELGEPAILKSVYAKEYKRKFNIQ